MKIVADTNLLVRAVMGDDEHQSELARDALDEAAVVALALPALCEFVWVLRHGYKLPPKAIAVAIRRMISGANAATDRASVEAGLALLESGGDFADGVIAYEGRRLGADTFVSFDRRAVTLLERRGWSARLCS